MGLPKTRRPLTENSCFVLSLAKERESCLGGWSISIDSIPQLLHRTDLQSGYHAMPENDIESS